MSEKRFRVRFEQEDGRGEIVNEKGVELTAREVVDLLNNLHQENQELQEKIMKVKQSNNHYYTEYYRIKEENEQLREINKELGEELYESKRNK